MGLKYCSECDKLYAENSSGMCLDCQREEEQMAEQVTDFLREFGKATIDEVHKATGVKHKTILRLIRTDRISTEHGFTIFFNCESCGKPIPEGRFCDLCGSKLSSELKEQALELIKQAQPTRPDEVWPRTGVRMYSRETDKKS